ncbi:MAG: class I SAM-dependent methyltransferase [Deltaproteobacteria bacterium]|jgi:2-polyprenyl-3-methyl-5-hydroxy-6-metoxy-1,4-benzoquinol methylase|nr:class I SAM-dependent methyltransferase [Deltaproteobacteria bacterium]
MSSCHACESEHFQLVLSDPERQLVLNRCTSCGFVYLASWRDSLARSEELYDYYCHIEEDDLTRRHTAENRARHLQLFSELGAYTDGRRLLDVGCGDGQLLRSASEAGWQALGIDLSGAAVGLCRKQGLDAAEIDFHSERLDTRRFDVIVMSELIEHVPSPAKFLARAAALLDSQGVLYLTTPNFGSLARRALRESWSVIHPEHIGYFERSTLRQMACDGAGLRELRIDANNISPSTIVAWLKPGKRRTKISVAEQHRNMRQGLDQRLRRSIHARPGLQKLKVAVNRIVSPLGLGDTLVAWFQKP